MLTRRFITLASATLGASALLLGSALSGHAQIPPGTINLPAGAGDSTLPISDAVVFTGQAGIVFDNTTSALGVPCPGAEPDNPAAVELVGCGGTFNFGSAACVGASEPGLPVLDPEGLDVELPGLCTVTVNNGSFQNLVCGTGFVQGNVAITGFEGYSGNFGIVFAGTIGVATANLNPGNDYFVGVVQLGPPLAVPPPPNPADPTDCTSQFTVTVAGLAFDVP